MLPETWAKGFLWGLVSLPLMSFLPWMPPLTVLVASLLGVLGDRVLAVSGSMVGFGGLWLVLIGSQLISGGQSDTYPMAIGFGVVVFALGLVLTAFGCWRYRQGRAQ